MVAATSHTPKTPAPWVLLRRENFSFGLCREPGFRKNKKKSRGEKNGEKEDKKKKGKRKEERGKVRGMERETERARGGSGKGKERK